MIIGFEGFEMNDIIYLSIGVFSGGCRPVASNDVEAEILLLKKNSGIAVVRNGKVVSMIYDGLEAPTGITLNKKHDEIYLHTYNVENEKLEGYLTSLRIDPRIFAGLYACMIGRGIDYKKAFLDAMDILALGEGNPFDYLRMVLSEYKVFRRLYNALNRLFKNKSLMEKIITDRLFIGGRGLSDTVYTASIIKAGHGFIKECIEPLNINIYTEYKWIHHGEHFICGLTSKVLEFAEKYGFKKYIDNNLGNCIIGDDPVRLVILLEKYISI